MLTRCNIAPVGACATIKGSSPAVRDKSDNRAASSSRTLPPQTGQKPSRSLIGKGRILEPARYQHLLRCQSRIRAN